MSQKAMLQAFDQSCISGSIGSLADTALYTAPAAGSVAVACDVMVNPGGQVWGDDAMPVALGEISIAFQRSQVNPERGGIVVVDGDTYRLTDRLPGCEPLSRWLVVPHG